MAEEGVAWQPHAQMLSFEEMERLCVIFARLGVKKVKITGGEPLVKKGVVPFMGRVRKTAGIESVTLTTNGVLLRENLKGVIEAGVSSVNISLDSLDRRVFEALSGRDLFDAVRASLDAALDAARRKEIRVKINMVPLRGKNDAELEAFAAFARDNEVFVRFIELMPLGIASGYTTVPNSEVFQRIAAVVPRLCPAPGAWGNGPAVYYASPEMKGKIGFISALSSCFCASCNRIRLDSQGRLKPCLSSDMAGDLKALLRGGAGDDAIQEAVRALVRRKPAAHVFAQRGSRTPDARRMLSEQNMFRIGG
jgi:cyclic pyranopterin phosphate synthase